MIAIHILALMIGALPVYATATGKLTGGYVDETDERREGGVAAVIPAIAGLIVMGSALGGILQ